MIETSCRHNRKSIKQVNMNRINKLNSIFDKVFEIPKYEDTVSILNSATKNSTIPTHPIGLPMEKTVLKNPKGVKRFITL